VRNCSLSDSVVSINEHKVINQELQSPEVDFCCQQINQSFYRFLSADMHVIFFVHIAVTLSNFLNCKCRRFMYICIAEPNLSAQFTLIVQSINCFLSDCVVGWSIFIMHVVFVICVAVIYVQYDQLNRKVNVQSNACHSLCLILC